MKPARIFARVFVSSLLLVGWLFTATVIVPAAFSARSYLGVLGGVILILGLLSTAVATVWAIVAYFIDKPEEEKAGTTKKR